MGLINSCVSCLCGCTLYNPCAFFYNCQKAHFRVCTSIELSNTCFKRTMLSALDFNSAVVSKEKTFFFSWWWWWWFLCINQCRIPLELNVLKPPTPSALPSHSLTIPLYLIETPFYTFANRADPDQAALVT